MAPINDEIDGYRSWTASKEAVVYLSIFSALLVLSFIIMCAKMSRYGQKTRNPQQRRMYVGGRARPRPSLSPQDPTIYVSPSNLPPPPKYECMAPPSYEEVVGIHYPQYNAQPISQPINAALAQGSSTAGNDNVTSITVINEQRRTSVTVART